MTHLIQVICYRYYVTYYLFRQERILLSGIKSALTKVLKCLAYIIYDSGEYPYFFASNTPMPLSPHVTT